MGDLSRGDKEGFDLHDFDGDGVPELLIGRKMRLNRIVLEMGKPKT